METPDALEQFMRATGNAPAGDGDLFSGSEPVPAEAAPPAATPAPEVPADSAPAIVADVANTTLEAALAEVIRRLATIERYLRRNGADV